MSKWNDKFIQKPDRQILIDLHFKLNYLRIFKTPTELEKYFDPFKEEFHEKKSTSVSDQHRENCFLEWFKCQMK